MSQKLKLKKQRSSSGITYHELAAGPGFSAKGACPPLEEVRLWRRTPSYTRSRAELPDLDSNQDTRLQRAKSYH